MLRERLRRFRPFSSPVVPVEGSEDLMGWHGAYGDAPESEEPADEELAPVEGATLVSSVTACPVCGSSMAVEELDLVGRVARLVCGDCGLLRGRRLPALSPS
jgi:ribosomal protein S27AE